MFDFLDNDYFIITINIVFLVFIIFDIQKFRESEDKKYLLNILLTLGFAIWVMIPFYNKYITWSEKNISELSHHCEENNRSLCSCITDWTIKSYSYESFMQVDKNSSDYRAFLKETKQECLED
jgi:hypothetical protein